MKTHLALLLLAPSLWAQTPAPAPAPSGKAQILSVQKISGDAPHCAFTDLIRFQNLFYCAFRESSAHVGGEGQIRIMLSFNGAKWKDTALIKEKGTDLRDPKLAITKEGRLICFMGGSIYDGTTLVGRRPRVATSTDGEHWSPVEKTLTEGDWLWRAVMHPTEKCFYGTVYNTYPTTGGPKPEAEWSLKLVKSEDGKIWQLVAPFDIKGRPNEATARVLANGDMVALVRREAPSMNKGMLGVSKAPYRQWTWTELSVPLGGPDFIQLPDSRIIAGTRGFGTTPGAHMVLSQLSPTTGLTPHLELPSSGDCSYPGLVYHDGILHVSYYSSHEGKTAVYLAKVQP
jgi:hypothetical protein